MTTDQERGGSEGHEPRFSIILATHSRPVWLAEAIDSVLAQTIRDFELLVIDDASDPPAAVVSDPRIRLVRLAENVGLAVARNVGLDQARGRSIAFLDDDDMYTPERLELAALGLERAPVAICGSRFLDAAERRNRALEGNVADTILDDATPSMAVTAVRRDVMPRFDERWDAVEDVDWWLRAAQQLEVATVPGIGLLVRRHDTPRWRNDRATRANENLALLEAHADFFATHRRAAAFRLKRAGLLSLHVHDYRQARAAFRRSVRLHPQAATVWHFARASRPTPSGGKAPSHG